MTATVNQWPRVICFIDDSNLFSHMRDAFGSGKHDREALCTLLAGPDRELVEWRFFTAQLPDPESDKQVQEYEARQRFLHVIETSPKGVLRLGRFLQEGPPHNRKLREKGVDVLLAVDLVRLAARDAYDVAIVLSGDEDIVPAIDVVRSDYGKRVEVALPADTQAYHVRQAADAFVDITQEMFEKVRL